MKRKIMHIVTILTLLAVAFSLAAWALGSDTSLQKAEQGRLSSGQTLKEIGRQRDVEGEVPISEGNAEYDDLYLLAKHSDAIVIGRIVKEESAFSGEDHIVTTYLVEINRVLSDKMAETISTLKVLGEHEPPAPLSTPLKIVREGGVVSIDGHHVAKTLRGSEALRVGQDYILFVNWSRDFKAYRLAGGVSGAVLIDSDLAVKPLGSGKGLAIHRGTPLESFVAKLLANL